MPESEHSSYYGYPSYWQYGSQWPMGVMPGPGALTTLERLELEERRLADALEEGTYGDSHLRSSGEVCAYHVCSGDDRVGYVDDFLFDDETWALRFVIVVVRRVPRRKVQRWPAR
ncbi:MAG: hypothetical protein ACREP9_16915 [Candidatus Dormibacteraceae bacterium]